MKKLILILLAFSLVVTGCKIPEIVTQTKTEIIYRDTVVELPPIEAKLPPSFVEITTKLKVIDGKINLPKQVKKDGIITTELWIVDGEAHSRSYLNDSTLLVKPGPVVLKEAIREEKTTSTSVLPPEKYVPKFYKILLAKDILVLLALATWLAIKYKIGNLLDKVIARKRE